MSQKRKPRAGTWHLREEHFEVRTRTGLTCQISFFHEPDMTTQARIVFDHGDHTFRGEATLSKSDTYSRSAGRILALTRAMQDAALPRDQRAALWAIMPDVRAKKAPQGKTPRAAR